MEGVRWGHSMREAVLLHAGVGGGAGVIIDDRD